MKPYAYNQWEHYGTGSPESRVTAYLLHNEPPSYLMELG